MITVDDIRQIALGLPGAEERASYGGLPSWRTKSRMFTRVRDEPDSLVVWVESEDEKHALISSEPAKFFTTPHYDGHAVVLVRLSEVDVTEAQELITESWRLRAPRSLVRRWEESA